MSLVGWMQQKWQEVRATVWDAANNRFLPTRGDTAGRLETRPHGSVPLPFRQVADGTLLVQIIPAWRFVRFARRFWTFDSLGNRVSVVPSLLIWTTHVFDTGALVETLSPIDITPIVPPGGIIINTMAADVRVPVFAAGSPYTENVHYHHQWRFRIDPDREQVQRARFMFVT